jgi:FkbM family methyltransferase
MNTNIGILSGFKYGYFKNDMLGIGSIGKNIDWEPHITNFTKLYNNFYSIKNIIDVGANFGYHTLLFSKQVKENVYAFEPQIQNFKLLENNIQHNDIKNIEIFNFACGDTNCDVKLPIVDSDYIVNMGDITVNNYSNNFSITKSITLDSFNFGKIDLIKIDVQGWEKKVLNGAINLLKKDKPVLIVEFEDIQLGKTNTTSQDLFDFIRTNNYYIFYLEYEYPADHICVHNDNLNDFRNKFSNYIFAHDLDNCVNHNVIYGVSEKIVI